MTTLGNKSIQFMLENVNNIDKILQMSDDEILKFVNKNEKLISENESFLLEESKLSDKDISNIEKLINMNNKIIDAINDKLDRSAVYTSKHEELEEYAYQLEEVNQVLMLRSQNSIAKLARALIRNIYIFMKMFPLISTIIYNIVGLSIAGIGTLFAMKALAANVALTVSAFIVARVSIFITLWFVVFNLGDYIIDKINIIGINERDKLTPQKAKEIVREGQLIYKDAEIKLKSLK